MNSSKYILTIGIECHVQLKTETKLFAAVSNDARAAEPNTTVSPICFGLPGTLPVLNEKAVELAIRAGLALNGDIAERMKFDRKNYFYPDLPKGYQITQYDEPIVKSGHVDVPLDGRTFKVRIERAHMEEDAGKNIHPNGKDYSLVDLNRAGTPLLEIVSAPDMHSPEEARAYAHELYLIMKYADVTEADLYHGNMRFDVNISLALTGAKQLGVRTEIKNINSFRAIERAVAYEVKRQTELLESGKPVAQETRGWDEAKQRTISQRTKEEAHDYRYFPEPDVPPVHISRAEVKKIKGSMPETVGDARKELRAIGLDENAVKTLIDYPAYVDGLRHIHKVGGKKAAHFAANLIINVWFGLEEPESINLTITPQQLSGIYRLVEEGQISSTNAKQLFIEMQGRDHATQAEDVAQELGLLQVSDTTELEKFVEQAIKENPQAAEDIKKGEIKAIGFLTGRAMKLSGGQANPQKVGEIIKNKLGV